MADEKQTEQTVTTQAASQESAAQVKSVDGASQADSQQDTRTGPEKLAERIKQVKEETEQESGTEGSGGETQDAQGDVIPAEFVAAARANGWSDDQITEFAADYKDDELKGMVADLTPAEKQEAAVSETPKKVEQKGQEQPSGQSELAAVKAELDALKKLVGESTKETQQQKVTRQEQHANTVFDELGKTWDEFGQTDKLPKFPTGQYIPSSPQMKARVEVWGSAQEFHQKLGVPWEQAMKMAVNQYKGEHGEAHAKSAVVKDIKTNAKRLTAKRSSKATEKVYENEDERKADVIASAARDQGVDLSWMK